MKEGSFIQKIHIDVPLLFGIIVLSMIGFLVLYSASGQDTGLIFRRSIHLGMALMVMFAIAHVSPARLSRLSVWIYLVSLGLLILVLYFGETGKGALRWLDVGIFRFQPSEIMKLALPMVIAWYLSEKLLPPTLRQIFIVLILILIPVLLVAKQPDLGTAILMAITGFSVLFIAGIGWKLLAGFAFIAVSSTPVLWYLMHDYQKERVLTFLGPGAGPARRRVSYHSIQNSNRIRRAVRQGLVKRDPVSPGILTREIHGFYFRGFL